MHEIRLAGPWEVSTETASEWTRSMLPFESSAEEGTLRLRRKFHRPSGLTSESKLFIAAAIDGPCELELNGVILPSTCENGEFLADVSKSLGSFNDLQIVFAATAGSFKVSNVRLCIIEPADSVNSTS